MTRRTPAVAPLKEAYAHALALLFSRPEVTGVDIGPKYTNSTKTRKLVVRVHVRRKHSERRVPSSQLIPTSFLGVQSDVVQALYRSHSDTSQAPTDRFDTIRPGISVGNIKASAGTLGLIVFDRATGDACLLSAAHVLAGPEGVAGDPITQPARLDGGKSPKDTVARLFNPIPPGHWGDAAIARLNDRRPHSADIFAGDVRLDAVGAPRANLRVSKSGRTTGLTRGRIEGLGRYRYPARPDGVDGFRIVPEHDEPTRFDLAANGDSGAIYYATGTRTGIGLHCAGGVDPVLGEVGIACTLSTVFATLGVSLAP